MKFVFLEALAQTLSILGACILVPALVVILIQGVNTFTASGGLMGALLLFVGFWVVKKLEKQQLIRSQEDTCK